MNDEAEVRRVYYPLWAKILGGLGLPALVVVGVYVAFMPLLEDDPTTFQTYFLPPVGIAVLYQCFVGARCLPHLNTVASIFDDGVEVVRHGRGETYEWRELEVTEFALASTTGILKKDGSPIVYFSDSLPNLGLLVYMINNYGE